ncbi:hypothetical protein TRVL_03537 [Trypanosoma vivax]|nr:hypothetical protein TRVL_03537 [Trypanosoma vivax]
MSLATVGRFLETVDSRDKLLKGASALAKLFLYASGNAAYGQIALSASEARRIIRLLGWLSSVQVLSYLLRKDWGNKHDLLAIARVTGEFVFKLCDNIAFLGAKAGILTNGAVQFSYGSRLGLFFAYVFAVALGCLDLQRFKDNKVARQRHCMVLLQRTCDMLCAASGVRFGGFQMSRVLDASLALLSASISSVANYRDLTARLGG